MNTLLIAEIGVNHNGDIKLAHKMLDAAADNGANVVKFQVHIADKEMVGDISNHVKILPQIYKLIQEVSLNFEDFLELKKHADSRGVTFLATPFSIEAVDWLEKLGVGIYKIGSGECSDLMLINKVLLTKKRVLISTGMSSEEEINKTVNFIRNKNGDFVLLHCTSEYPCPHEKVNLGKITKYAKQFQCLVGFSDHSPTIYPSIAAIALGASVIEKHFTIDKTLPGTDQKSSLLPAELKQLKDAIEVIEVCMQSNKFEISEEVRQLFMHGITSVRDIKIGERITNKDISSKRPLIGIGTADFEKVIGRRVIHNINKDSQIFWNDLD